VLVAPDEDAEDDDELLLPQPTTAATHSTDADAERQLFHERIALLLEICCSPRNVAPG